METEEEKKEDDVQMADATTASASPAGGHAGATKDPSFMTARTFASLPPTAIHADTVRAITGTMKLNRLTEVQLKTLVAVGCLSSEEDLDGNQSNGGGEMRDVLGRARTGTGKTVAFLLPALQTVIEAHDRDQGAKRSADSIRVLIISPTRELATQISVQAEAMLTHHSRSRGYSQQVVYGGTSIKKDISAFNQRLPTILVATPGRLKDHLENTQLRNGRNFRDCVQGLRTLVLDEADQLLEMGFRPEILRIVKYLPPKEYRQTLLFSATMPKDLRSVMAETMKQDHVVVDCIKDRGAPETNAHVTQSHIILPSMDRCAIAVVEVILRAMESNPDSHKIMAFFPTARQTGFFADVFNKGMQIKVHEIHSRKSQSHRDKESDRFRLSRRGVLFSSDVSARGVDYPDVTSVVQFGLPDGREQYIHRLGRTGRAGRAGKGWLVLCPFEESFLRELKTVDCPEDKELAEMFRNPPSQNVQDRFLPVLDSIRNKRDLVLVKSAEMSYQAYLGFYNGNLKRIGMAGRSGGGKEGLVKIANEFAVLMGLPGPPPLEKRTVGKMGMKGVPGLNVVNVRPR